MTMLCYDVQEAVVCKRQWKQVQVTEETTAFSRFG